MKKNSVVIFLFFFLSINTFSSEKRNLDSDKLKFSVKEDFYDSLDWSYKGSYMQFQRTQNLVFAGAAILSTLYFIKNDERISNKSVQKHKNEKIFRLISDTSIFFNTPVMPFLFYSIGVSNQDGHMVQFSKEYFSALILSLLETTMISAVPVHQRPDQKDLSFWEKAFRGQSSFPSGHVVGYSVLGFKTLQFYGPHYAIAPFALAAATGFERVHAEKHFISDVVASGFISLLASEGVRYASGYNKNHSIYKWIFNHNFSLNYIRKDKIPGLLVSFNF